MAHMLKDEAAIVQTAPKMGVQEVVFVDWGGDDRGTHDQCSRRAGRVRSRALEWYRAVRQTRAPKDTLANLTCQALGDCVRLEGSGS